MKVFCMGEKPSRQPLFLMCVAPAATVRSQEVPAEWVDEKNNPVQFKIEFIHGQAEVDDAIGKYLIENGLAKKTRLILPKEAADIY